MHALPPKYRYLYTSITLFMHLPLSSNCLVFHTLRWLNQNLVLRDPAWQEAFRVILPCAEYDLPYEAMNP